LAEQTGARLYLSDEGGADWKYGWLGARSDGAAYDHVLIKNDDRFMVGNIEFRVVHTPGHTPEHVTFLVTDVGGGATSPMGALTGDFVFVGDLGRPDLLETAAGIEGIKEDSARDLFRSVNGFLGLEDYMQVWPAHGAGSACGKALGAVPQSTVGYERQFNPALRLAGEPQAFVDFVLEGQPEPPLYFARMKQQNRDGVPILGGLPQPRELQAAVLRDLDRSRNVVVDTRCWEEFRDAHLDGALHAPLGAAFHSVVGSYIQPADSIVLVAERDNVGDAVRELVRIGLDRVVAFATPETQTETGLADAKIEEVEVRDVREMLDRGNAVLLDVRRSAELAEGSIDETALHAAHTRLPLHLDAIPRDRPLLVHCASGRRSAFASAYLRRQGYNAINVAGGLCAWNVAAGVKADR
jgi:hydroxyacylglutathione hydrolase